MNKILDQEWIDLIWEAKSIGLSMEEVKTFINQNQTHFDTEVLQKNGLDKIKSI
ncbi:MAG TPA: anti-repressor SinI family protein [Bacillota bacterium]|nr:anti-repressor SinI family protein [Bacillota bacterium]